MKIDFSKFSPVSAPSTVDFAELDSSAFLTGSRAYGIPTARSDIDLVVPLPGEVVQELLKLAQEGSKPPGSVSLKFGKLNLIVPTSEDSLQVWRSGTSVLAALKPVERKTAVEHFTRLRRAAGIE
jgi:hypothetical protein